MPMACRGNATPAPNVTVPVGTSPQYGDRQQRGAHRLPEGAGCDSHCAVPPQQVVKNGVTHHHGYGDYQQKHEESVGVVIGEVCVERETHA